MKNAFKVKPGNTLRGIVTIPTSKSHTLRAILFATLASGKSTIHHYLDSPDTKSMISACRLLGAKIDVAETALHIIGVAGKLTVPDDVIDAGNSGQVLRFIGAIAGLMAGYTVITGDDSVRNLRPVSPLLDGLTQLGAFAVSSRHTMQAPIIVRGPIQPATIEIDGQDSQPVSGLLIAAAFAKKGTTRIKVCSAGEKPWVALTLGWFDFLGISYQHKDFETYTISGGHQIQAFDYTVPGDFSSLAFPLAAALVTDAEITIQPVDMNDSQGDKQLIEALTQMGARFSYDPEKRQLTVLSGATLQGKRLNINNYIDSITILAVIACKAAGETIITGAAIARLKECNRIEAICAELTKMGARIKATADGLIVQQSTLRAANVSSHQDHRMAMSLAVAALMATGDTVIDDTACVSKSFPRFAKTMQSIGMDINEYCTDRP